MPVRTPIPALAVLFALTGCVTACDTNAKPALATPVAVSCPDAPQLKQRSVDDRHRAQTTKSDQDKIIATSRASYLAALAIVADLKCKNPAASADGTLKSAFDAARKAETRSFYEAAVSWSEANVLAIEAIAVLLQQVSPEPSK